MSFTRTGRKLSDSRRQNYRMRRGKSLRPTTFSMKRLEWSSSIPASAGIERRGNRPLLMRKDRKCGECTVSSTHIRLHLNGKDGGVPSDIPTPLQPLNMWFKGSSRTTILNKKKGGGCWGCCPTAAQFVRRPYVHMLLLVRLHPAPRTVVCLLGKVPPEYFMV